MKGDFSRYTWDRTKRYSGVLMQQGRVSVDADWNEQIQIQHHREQQTDIDVIGQYGTTWSKDPARQQDSFRLATRTGTGLSDLTVQPGVAYVDGLQVVFDPGDLPTTSTGTTLELSEQVDLHNPAFAYPTESGTYVVYLEAWERHVDALEDEEIREVALGGPDTASRKQIVWQLNLLRLAGSPTSRTEVLGDTAWQKLTTEPTGTLDVTVASPEDEADPCEVPEEGGYSGLENQLYRIQIHDGNFRIVDGAFVSETESVTFLWCRENGSVSVALLDKSVGDTGTSLTLSVSSTGRDENLGFAVNDWVELTCRDRELSGEPGLLVQVSAVDAEENTLIVELGTVTEAEVADLLGEPGARVRRWSTITASGARAITEYDETDTSSVNWMKLVHLKDGVSLDEGIRVRFGGGTYRTGDFWVIPARSITGEIAWSVEQTAHGDRHRYLMLGLATLTATSGESPTYSWGDIIDLRQRFVPLNEQIHMFMEGGDGQSGMPGAWLRAPLRVGVSNGMWPIAGAKVKFEIEHPRDPPGVGSVQGGLGAATLSGAVYNVDAPASTVAGTELEVETDQDGIAMVWWRLADESTASGDNELKEYLHCRVRAKLIMAHVDYDLPEESAGEEAPLHLVAHFTANPSVARDVAWDGDCEHLESAETVTEAVDLLCENYALYYVGGDGQSGAAGATMTVPLTVRVANGEWGISGVKVRFWVPTSYWGSGINGIRHDTTTSPVIADKGTFSSSNPSSPSSVPLQAIELITDTDGYASVHLVLSATSPLAGTYRDIVYASIVEGTSLVGTLLVFNGTVVSSTSDPGTTTSTIRTLAYVAGDGQTGLAGRALDGGLVVRVSDASGPRSGSVVRFTVGFLDSYVSTLVPALSPIQMGGVSSTTGSVAPGGTALGVGSYFTILDVVTDSNGFASARWMLGTYGGVEKFSVKAELLSAAPGSAVDSPAQAIGFVASAVNRPAPTRLLSTSGSSANINRLDTFDWSTFGGFIFPWMLITVPTSVSDESWLPAVDVEMEVPEVYSTATPPGPNLLGTHWVRFQGTVSTSTGNNGLIWTLTRNTSMNSWVYGVKNLMESLGRTKTLIRVVVRPSLIPEGLGRGDFDVESRFYMNLDATAGRPDDPGRGGILDIPIRDVFPTDPVIDLTDLDRPIVGPGRRGGGPG